MECQVEKLQHFWHILLLFGLNHSFLFLMLVYKHHFSSPVTIQNRNGRCCSQANRWQASRDAHVVTRWFLFWLRACGTHTPDIWTLPIEIKCRTKAEWSQLTTFSSSRVHWRGSLWINVFKRFSSNPEVLTERGVSLMSSLKRENHYRAVLSQMTLSPYTAQIFLAASAAFAPLLNSKRRICRKCFNFSTWHSIFYLRSLFQTTKFQYVNWSTTTEFQIKSDNRWINQ